MRKTWNVPAVDAFPTISSTPAFVRRSRWKAHGALLALSLSYTLAACVPHASPLSAVERLTVPASPGLELCGDEPLVSSLFAVSASTRLLLLTGAPKPGGADPLVERLLKQLAKVERTLEEPEGEAPLKLLPLACPCASDGEANLLGMKHSADGVIWLEATGGSRTLHLTLLEREPGLRESGSTRYSWGEITSFDFPDVDLSSDFVGAMLLGLHFYRVDQPRLAVNRLTEAVRSADAAGLSKLYALHGLLGFSALLNSEPLGSLAALRLAEEQARAAGSLQWEAIALRAQADALAARGELSQAQERYLEARTRYASAQMTEGEADCLVGLGDLHVRFSDYAEARRLYLEALPLYETHGDGVRTGMALRALGDVEIWACRYDKAAGYFERAQALFALEGVKTGHAQMLQRMGDVRLWVSDTEGAVRLYEQALEEYLLKGDPTFEATCLMSLGNAWRLAADYAKARALYEQALELFRQTGSELGQANALRALGDILSLGTTYLDARFSYEKALALYESRGNLQGQAACLRGLAWLERSFGVGYAKRQYQSALFLSHKAADKVGEAHSRLGLGQLAVSRLEYFEAKENFDIARALYQEAGYTLGEAQALQGLAEVAWGFDQRPEARGYYQESLRLFRESDLRLGELQCHLANAQAAMRAGALEDARASLNTALPLATGLHDRLGEASAVFLRARVLVRQKKASDAIRDFEKAREIYRSLGVVRLYAIATSDLGTHLLTLNREAEGKAYLEEASALFTQIGLNGEADSCKSLIAAPPVLDITAPESTE